MREIMVPVNLEDILADMEDDDLIEEMESRGLTVAKVGDPPKRRVEVIDREAFETMMRDLEATYRMRDDTHFAILLDRVRGMCD